MKKKIAVLFLSFALIFVFAGCGDEFKFSDIIGSPEEAEESDNISLSVKKYSKSEWSSEYGITLSSVSYPAVIMNEKDAKEFSGLARALEESNEEIKERNLELFESYLSMAEEYAENDFLAELYNHEEVYVTRADKTAVCLLYFLSDYTGGAHGYYCYNGKNYDTETGNLLELSDVISDMDSLPGIIETQLETLYEESAFLTEPDMEEYFEDNTPCWILGNSGITFIFNPYEISSYAAGCLFANVSFDEYPGIFNEKYVVSEKAYTSELPFDALNYCDIDSDGTPDRITISKYKSNYESPVFDKLTITVNDEEFEEEIYSYDSACTFVHTEDGKNYLYIECMAENAYCTLSVYGFENSEVEKIAEIDGSMHRYIEEDGTSVPVRNVITDSARFELMDRTDILGTVFGSRTYCADEDGIPVPVSDWYTLSEERTLTLLEDIEADKVDKNTGKIKGKTTLKEDDEVVYFRTDNESFADLLLSDGTVARVYAEHDDWPKTIDGTDITEIFDGIMFAG